MRRVLGEVVVDFFSESSLLLFWLGGWNLICLLIEDDSIAMCLVLMLLGIVFRVLFCYSRSVASGEVKETVGNSCRFKKKRKKRNRLVYLQVYSSCHNGK